MDMFQVEERGFYVKVTCNNGEGTAVSLYKALESLTNFNVNTSNLATVSDTFVLTFTLKVSDICIHIYYFDFVSLSSVIFFFIYGKLYKQCSIFTNYKKFTRNI